MQVRAFIITLLFFTSNAYSQNQLIIPDTVSGPVINLTLQQGTQTFFTNPTQTLGCNGPLLGPTILLNQGDQVSMMVNNQLPDTTTIHWHGMHVSAENDGGPHTTIPPGTTWNPAFTVMDKAAVYWYHPHLHMHTNEHVSKGIAGMIIVRDNDEGQLVLPRTYGLDDIPLVIQTKDFDANDQIVVMSNSDDVLMTNGTIDPYTSLPAQVVRLRLLNGSSQRVFNIGLSNNGPMYQIASDGGLLNAPYQTTRIMLAPGERAEILLNLTGMAGQNIQLKSYASELPNGIYGATNPGMMPGMVMTGYNPNPMNGTNFDILDINIINATANAITTIPATLVSVVPLNPANSNITRNLTFSPVQPGPNQLNGQFWINNTSFNMNVINYSVPIDNTEIWELFNQSAISHPFHIHDVQFYILSRNGVAPALNEAGRKDVVLVRPQETVRFIARFEDFHNDTVPYMYHCHMLTHEDGGMMGQFVVTNPLGLNEGDVNGTLMVYPSPSSGYFKIQANDRFVIDRVEMYSIEGRLHAEFTGNGTSQLFVEGAPDGFYILRIFSGDKVLVRKVLVE